MSKTVRVKIAVGIAPSGAWCANGWHNATGAAAAEFASEVYETDNEPARGVQVHWVYADIPLPEPQHITAAAVEPR